MQQVVVVRGKQYFVCDYTGAFLEKAFYLPKGNNKEGCFATLPILLRYYCDKFGGDMDSKEFIEVKQTVLEFFNQPDIPIAPVLKETPLSQNQLDGYVNLLELGSSWYLVPQALYADSMKRPKKRKKEKK